MERVKGIVSLLAVLLGAACHDRPGDDPANDAFVAGVAYLGGPIADAEVVVYQLVSDTGARGVERGRGRTDADGRFEVAIGAALNTVELDVIGGRYLDVATGAIVLRDDAVLHGLAFELGFGEKRGDVAVTPWSHLAVALGGSRAAVEDGGRGAAMAHARTLFAAHLGFDPTATAIAPLDRAAPSPSPTPALQHALALAGLAQVAQLANDDGFVDVTAASFVDALAIDAADRGFDGDGGQRAVTAVCPPAPIADCDVARSACEPTCRVTPHTLRATLANAIRVHVRAHPATGQTAATLASWLEGVRTADEPLLFPPGPPEPFDARGPRLVWIAPADGSPVAGSIGVEAQAADPIGVATLTLAALGIGGRPIADTDAATDRVRGSLDTVGLPEGAVAIRATASDRDGNVSHADRAIVVDNLGAGSASGVVVKGRVAGAAVRIHAYADGVRGAQLGSGVTAADGTFTNVAIAGGYSGPLLIEAGGGGSYAEDAAPPGTPAATLDLTDLLRTVVPDYGDGGAVTDAVVSPLTTFAVRYASWRRSVAPTGDVAAQWIAARDVIAASFGVADIATTAPRAPDAIGGDATADRYGLILIGLSQLAYVASTQGGGDAGSFATAMDSMRVVAVLDLDLADGCLDGRAGATPLAYGGSQRPGDQTVRLDLASAIATYLRDPTRDLTGLAVADVLPLLDTLATNGPASGSGSCVGGGLFATAGAPFDRTAPTIVWQAPTPDDGAWVRGTLVVRATAVDDVDRDPVVSWLGGLIDSDGDLANAVATATIATTAADDGGYPIAARAVDDAGNLGELPTRTVRIDNTAPVLTVAAAGFHVDGDGALWTGASAPAIGGSITEANLAAIVAYRGAAAIATATVAGSTWTVALPAGTVPDAAGVDLRFEARDLAGNVSSVGRRLHLDATPPVLATPATTIKDEANDSVSYGIDTAFPFDFIGRDPTHLHGAAAVVLGATPACDATSPTISKYAYLLDELAAPYVTEIGGGGPQSRNPLTWRLTVADDGVGIDSSSIAYRVRHVPTATVALDWRALSGVSPFTVPLYRRGVTGPSIAALGALDGLYAIELRARDRLGRETTITRCWNHRVLAAPVLVGPLDAQGQMAQCGSGATSCAATHGPIGSGKYALNLLSLGDTTAPIDPIGAQVLVANAPGTGLMQYPVWNPTTEPIFLTIDLTPPSGATYRRQDVVGRWSVQVASTSIGCGPYPGAGGPDAAIPGCGFVTRPSDPVPPYRDSGVGPSLAAYGVRIWEEVSPSSFVELVACPGCSASATRLTVRLPARDGLNPFGHSAPPRKFWVVPVVKTIGELRPSGTGWGEHAVAGAVVTGNIVDERYGCTVMTHNLTQYTCAQTTRFVRYNALASASGPAATFAIPGQIVSTPLVSRDGQSPATPRHFLVQDRQFSFGSWQTTEPALPPAP